MIEQKEEPAVVIVKDIQPPRNPLPKVIYLRDLSAFTPPPPTYNKKSEKRTSAEIIQAVLEKHNCSVADFVGFRKTQQIVAVRQEAAYLLASLTSMSLAAIGRVMQRDHTTIMHAIVTYCDRNQIPLPRGASWKKNGLKKLLVRAPRTS